MYKKLMILFFAGCLTLFAGYQVLAAETASLGDENGSPAYTVKADIAPGNSSSIQADSNQENVISDDSSLQYRPHRRPAHYHRAGYGPGSREMAIFMLFGMMCILLFLI